MIAPAPRRLRTGLAVLLVLVTASPGAARLSQRRPKAIDATFRHCPAERGGETRRASWCPEIRLLATRGGLTIPDGGTLEVQLDGSSVADGGPPVPDGPVLLVPEVLTYAEADVDAGLRRYLADESQLRTTMMFLSRGHLSPGVKEYGALQALEHFRWLRQTPQDPAYHPRMPERSTLRFAEDDRGRKALYALWAWTAPRAREVVTLEPIVPRPREGLSVSFAVPKPGWTPGSAAVTFRVLGGPPGTPGIVLWSRRIDAARRIADRGWLEAEIDLGDFAGRETSLVLEASTDGVGSALGFPMWGAPVLLAPARDDPPRPNVLLISLDTLRADHVGLYGGRRETTPFLDAFAGDGVVFERATSTFSSTTASHMSMLTSLQPCVHRVLLPGGATGTTQLSPTATTLAEALSAAGWETAAVTEDGLIKGDIGFDRGFDRYQDLVPDPAAPLGLFPDGIVLARSWIEAHADRPFFFFLHTYQPHEPFKAPPHLAGRWAPGPDAPEMAWLEAAYDEGIRHTDELLAGFLSGLERRGILDHTLVVVTSDHGQEFGERGGFGHARGVYLEQVHVPLVMRHPTYARGGRRVPDVVSLVDLAPTVLDLLGVPRPTSFAGRSVAPLLAGGALGRPAVAVAEHLGVGRQETLLRTRTHTWIQTPDGIRLHALGDDPGQTRDLAQTDPTLAAEGAARIAEFRRACEVGRAALEPAAPAPALDAERRRALEALGYVQ